MVRQRWLLAPLCLVLLIGAAAVVLDRIYADPLAAGLTAGAGLGAVAVGVALRSAPAWLPAPVSVTALAGYCWAAMWLAADRAGLPEPLPQLALDAVRNGIPRLLTAMLPAEATPDTVLVPVVAAWIAGLAGVEIAVRGGRVLLACLPAVVLYAAALYVVGPNAAAPGSVTVAVVAVVATALAVSAPHARIRAVDALAAAEAVDTADDVSGRVGGLRLWAAGRALGVVAALVALAATAGSWVGAHVSAVPVDPRRYVQPPTVDGLDESPLNRISGWALNPGQRLLTVSASAVVDPAAGGTPADPASGGTGAGAGPGGAAALRLRLAVLPDYDGVTWRVGATYRTAGRVLPEAPPPAGAALQRIRQEITVAELTGRLLPVVPDPTRVAGVRVAFDRDSGTVIRPEGLTPGLRYTVISARQVADLNLLPAAGVPSGAAVTRYLHVGDAVPERMERLAEQLATDNGAPYDRAAAIEQFLAEHYRLVGDAPSGHAYPNLAFFLFGPRQAGGQEGTSEQFAAAFAVLGRLMGLPTRVVVGFRVPAAGGPVTAGDAYAWPEVLFDELGWVAFDPRPDPGTPPRPVEADFKPEPEKSTPPPAPPPSAEPVPTADAPAVTALRAEPAGGAPLVVGAASGLLSVLVVAAFVVVVLRRAQHRRRLRSGSPVDRITGAWLVFTDTLRLAGRPAPRHLAATEVAAHAAAPDSGRRGPVGTETRPAALAAGPLPPVDALVAAINAGVFGAAPVDSATADLAVAQAAAYATALRARRPWWRRLWWSVHPGPLLWGRHRSLADGGRRRTVLAGRANLG